MAVVRDLLNRKGTNVVSVAPSVAPWRAAMKRGAKVAIELAAGEAASRGVEAGARLRLEP